MLIELTTHAKTDRYWEISCHLSADEYCKQTDDNDRVHDFVFLISDQTYAVTWKNKVVARKWGCSNVFSVTVKCRKSQIAESQGCFYHLAEPECTLSFSVSPSLTVSFLLLQSFSSTFCSNSTFPFWSFFFLMFVQTLYFLHTVFQLPWEQKADKHIAFSSHLFFCINRSLPFIFFPLLLCRRRYLNMILCRIVMYE